MLEATAALARDTDRFYYTDVNDPLAKPLFEELSYEYATRYGAEHALDHPSNKENQRYPPILFQAPRGAFVLLLRNGVAIAGGAFMPIDERTAEMKRIWTHHDFRRQGLSSRVLVELEAEAARRGFSRIYLTTGTKQPEARNLYLKNGYTPLFDVDAEPEEVGLWPFEKVIEPALTIGQRLSPRNWWRRRRQQKAIERAWKLRNPIARRLDDLVTG